jgi:hypothetical protein
MAQAEFFETNDWSVDSFIFHTVLVRRRPDKNVTLQLLSECEKYVHEQTGVKVTVKENQTL